MPKRIIAIVCLALTVCPALAENIGIPETAVEVGRIVPDSDSCGPASFVENAFRSDSSINAFDNRAFLITTPQGNQPIVASTSLQVRVHNTSGTVLSGDPFVNIESGQFSLYNAYDPDQGDPGFTLLIADIVGASLREDRSVIDFYGNVRYSSPGMLPPSVRSVRIRRFDSVFAINPPWQGDLLQTDCYDASPEITLYDQPIGGLSTLTYELGLRVMPNDTTECPYNIAAEFAATGTISFDANTLDSDPSPRVGQYLSCGNDFGSLSGATIRLVDYQISTSCVAITIENGTSNGFPTDRFAVRLMGNDSISGRLLDGHNQDGTGFNDDSLPLTAPPLDQFGDGFDNTFRDGFTRVTFSSNPACFYDIFVESMTQVSDADFDGVPDSRDNCVLQSNSRQRDSDSDGYGNACDADLNGDLIVNVLDVGLFKMEFGTQGNSAADFNSDGVVNFIDLGVMRQGFFQPPGPSARFP